MPLFSGQPNRKTGWNRALAAGVGYALLLSACGNDSRVHSPPEIIPGRDTCDECRMIISDETHACGLRAGNGEVFRFDDIGCLVRFSMKRDGEGVTPWVRDFRSGEWVAGRDATYLVDRKLSTPMGYGIIAFKDASSATAPTQSSTTTNSGNLLNFENLKDNVGE